LPDMFSQTKGVIMKKQLLCLVTILLLSIASQLWAIPHEERIVHFKTKQNERFGGLDNEFSPPYIKQDEHQNFRYLRALHWNLVAHKFATTPDFHTSEEAARFFLSDQTYGPVVGISDESTELQMIDKKIAYSGNSVNLMGRQFIRFQQYYMDIPVIGAELVVQLSSKLELISIIGRIAPEINQKDIDISPVISQQSAVNTALQYMSTRYQVAQDVFVVNSAEKGIFNQYIFDGTEAMYSLVWQIDILYNDQVIKILVDARLPDTVIMDLPIHPTKRLYYTGQTGAICDTYHLMVSGIQDTPADMPQTITDVTYSCNDDIRDGVFVNSGVGNKAAYLIAHGGTIQSGNLTINFTGIGEEITFSIFNEALNMLPIAADFYDFYYALLQASKNLGLPDIDTDHVKKAIDFVRMYAAPCKYEPIHGISDKPQCKFGCGIEPLFEDNFDTDTSPQNWIKGSSQGNNFWYVPQTSSDIGFNQSSANSGKGNIWAFAQKGPSDTWLAMRNSTQTLPKDSFLFFVHAFIFDASGESGNHLNGGVIEYSTDSGASWNDCSHLSFDEHAYNGQISDSSSNPLKGRNAYVGTSNGYIATIIDLSSLEGQHVRFRFRLGTGADLSFYGWFIDDFQIYTCDIFTRIPEICQNPTVQSIGSGLWSQASIWSTGKLPGPDDIVKINHTVISNINQMNVKALCNSGSLKTTDRNVNVRASVFINNEGTIQAASGENGYWSRRFINAADGKSVVLNTTVFVNRQNSTIQAGSGGSSFPNNSNIYAKAGHAGNVNIFADYVRNEGVINSIAGHGGSSDSFRYASAGDGASINVNGRILIEQTQTGYILSGNGGNARTRRPGAYTRPGNPGSVLINAPVTKIQGRVNFGRGGGSSTVSFFRSDPVLAFSDSARITGVDYVVIFGGDNWGLHMAPDVFSAQSIEIVMGEGSILDLTNSSPDAFRAKKKVILSIDESNFVYSGPKTRANLAKFLKNRIDAPLIEIQEPRIKYEFDINIQAQDSTQRKRSDITVEKGQKELFSLTIENNGPTRDIYSVELKPSESVIVSDIQKFVRIDAMSRVELPFEVTLPDIISDNYKIDVLVESCSSLDNKKSETVQLTVEPDIAMINFSYDKSQPGYVSFEATPADETIVLDSCQWNMADGSPIKNGANISHSYKDDGTYNVMLTVSDMYGYSETHVCTVIIKKSKILLLAADDIVNTPDALIGTSLFEAKNIDIREHPSDLALKDLLPYDAVLVWSKYEFTNPEAIGNALKEYAHNGGGVVLASYCFFSGELQIQGGILENGYSPFLPSGLTDVGQFISIAGLEQPDHFLFSGIQEIISDGRDPAYRIDENKSSNPVLQSDATLLAKDTHDRHVLAVNSGENVVALNMYPEQLITPGARRLLANALLFVSDQKGDLNVSTKEIHIPATRGSHVIDVTNQGNGSMYWEATTSDYWIKITGGSWGTDSGTITFEYDAYTDPEAFRVGEIKVSALGALNSPIKILVYQGENEPPAITPLSDQEMLEDHEISISFSVSDPETRAVDLLVSVQADNTVLVPDDRIRLNNPGKDRVLTISPAKDQFGVATISIKVSDRSQVVSRDFKLTVNAVNDSPIFVKGDNIVLKRNQHYDALQFPNWPAIFKSGPDNENEQLIVFHVQTTSQWAEFFDQLPNISSDGTLTFDPKDNFLNNKIPFTVYVSDNAGTNNGGTNQSDAQTFTIYFADDIPTFSKGHSLFVDEDCGAQTIGKWATDIDSGTDGSVSNISFITAYVTNKALFSEMPVVYSNGTLHFSPAPNRNGVAFVTIYLQDNDRNLKSESARFMILVEPVNDPPSFKGRNVSSVEDDPLQTFENWATDIVKGPIDEYSQSIRFEVTQCTNPELFSELPQISPEGHLTYLTAPDKNGLATIDVIIQDSGAENNVGIIQSFEIEVIPQNDPPSYTPGNTLFSYDEDTTCRTIESWASNLSKGPVNENSQHILFTVTTDNDQLFDSLPTVSSTGDLSFCFKADMHGIVFIDVTIQDDGSSLYNGQDIGNTETIAMQLKDINDCPSFVKGQNQIVPSNSGYVSLTRWASNLNPGNNEIHQSVSFNVTTDNDTLFQKRPEISPYGDLSFAVQPGVTGEATVYVQLQDNGSVSGNGCNLSDEQVFTIRSETNTVNLSLSATGNGNVKVNDIQISLPYNKIMTLGDIVPIEAIPDEGWIFDRWIGVSEKNALISINMNTSIQIEAIFIEKSQDETYTLSLQAGWNLFSCPLRAENNAVETLFSDRYEACYYYDANSGSYMPATHIEPGIGYWIKLNQADTFQIHGNIEVLQIDPVSGWNLLGSAKKLIDQGIITKDTSVYVYKNQAYQNMLIQNVDDMSGFWLSK